MMVSVSRRDTLAGLGGALAVLSLPAAASELVPMHVSIVPIWAVAPYFAADAQGYFAAEGLDVTSQATQSGVVGIPGLVSGGYDVCYTNSISALVALERGIDLRIVAVGSLITEKPPDAAALLMRKGDTLRTGKDLEGKTIAVNARRDIQWLIARAWVKATGGDPDKVNYREVPVPECLDALTSKQADAAIAIEPFVTLGLGNPALALLAWPFDMVMPDGPTSFWVVTGETADKKPALVASWVRAFRKGVAWVNENRGQEPFVKLVASYTKIDPALAARMNVPQAEATVRVAPIKRLVAIMRENGLLTADVDFESKIFHTS
jgi:NitT/TauT family transport system substrate-binding protein